MTGCGIKTVRRLLTCFVGHLDKDMKEDELCDYLSSVEIYDATCKKLESTDGRVFCTAAFRDSCREEFRVLFYNEDKWHAGAELRDWVLYNKRWLVMTLFPIFWKLLINLNYIPKF